MDSDGSSGFRNVKPAYQATHEGFTIKLSLIEVSRLKIHEETISELEDEIVKGIEELSVVLDPIVAEEEYTIVLDGMHRVRAFKKLGLKYAPACLVNYSDPRVRVYRWIRTVRFRSESMSKALRQLSHELERRDFDESIKLVNRRFKAACILGIDESYVLNVDVKDSIESSWVVRDVEGELLKKGVEIRFETFRDAFKKLLSSEVDALIVYQPVFKEEVVAAGLSGRLYAHKSTRHVIPARFLRVNVPIDLLDVDVDLDSANELFSKHLLNGKLIRAGKNRIIDGRRYEEFVYMFKWK